MESFIHQSAPCRVVFGAGTLARLADEAQRLGIARPLVLSSPGREALGCAAQAILGGTAILFADAATDIPPESYQAALALARDAGTDGLVSVGGGSTMGLGKALAAELRHKLVAVATTYSGSEMMDNWRIGSGAAAQSGGGPESRAATVIYDPELTITLPVSVSATTGVNGIAHAVESLYAPDAGPVSRWAGTAGIAKMADSLRRVARAPDDLAARTAALEAAFLCGGFRAGSGLEHRIAQTLRGRFNLEHAAVHAVVLPHVVAFYRDAAPAAMAAIADALGAADAADGLFALNDELDIAPSLAALGMAAADIEIGADVVMQRTVRSPRPYAHADVARLIENAFHGRRAP